MADLSFKVWHVALNCDQPGHRKTDADAPDRHMTEITGNKRDYIADARADGWIFHNDGKLTCPWCARASVSGDQ